MNELIKIQEKENQQLVSARELHRYLKIGRDFTTWIKERIEKYQFEENMDFTIVSNFPQNGGKVGRPRTDYILKLNMAKELSMLEDNEQGRKARKYFIECERKLTENKISLLGSDPDKLIDKLRGMIKQIEGTIQEIKDLRPVVYYTISEYLKKENVPIECYKLKVLGREVTKFCKKEGLEVKKVSSEIFGEINSYPESALRRIIGIAEIRRTLEIVCHDEEWIKAPEVPQSLQN